MSENSHLARYRPAVLAVTGLAAAAGIYAVYTTLSHRYPPIGLTRKRAVRGRPRQQPEIQVTYPDADSPLGTIVITKRDASLLTQIGLGTLPSPDDIRVAFGPCNEFDVWQSVVIQAVHSILETAKSAATPERRSRLRLFDLEGLAEAIAVGDRLKVEASKANVAVLLDLAPNDTRIALAFTDLLAEMQYPMDGDESHPGRHQVNADGANTESPERDGPNFADDDPSQGLKALLYYIAEEDAKRKAYEHRGINCEECGLLPIRGIRWHCLNCPDFDLCSMCEAHTQHTKTHTFAKIKIPLPFLSQPCKNQPIWYAGDSRRMHPPIDIRVKRNLCAVSGFEMPQIDAFYDQFCNTANVPWPDDPLRVQAAIDRRAFNKALTSERWSARFAPNILYDRMFAFYDVDGNGLIGFTELVRGLAYCRGPNRFATLDRALKGYDIDCDGYIDRTDFLRLLRAKYDIQKVLISSIVQSGDDEQTKAALDHLRSSQPISAVFTQEDIPQGEDRLREGKRTDADGDTRPLPGVRTILEDDDPWPVARETAEEARFSHETLRHHLSRFEEMLHGHGASHPPNPDVRVVQSSISSTRGNAQAILNGSELDNRSDQLVLDLALNADAEDDTADLPFDQDVLWHIAEIAFDETLDGLFQTRETVDADVQDTVDERNAWRLQINRAAEEKKAFEEELRRLATSDPLMATALQANAQITNQPRDQDTEKLAHDTAMVPTDERTLAKMEDEIARQPLADLLNQAGYSIDEPIESTSDEPPLTSVLGLPWSSPPESPDPTLPQNRPNRHETPPPQAASISANKTALPDAPWANQQPSRERLEYLATLNEAELEMRVRGGPGRLSYREIEEKVEMDSTKELRGLVLSWLEWAGF